jgi:hypothetical protein
MQPQVMHMIENSGRSAQTVELIWRPMASVRTFRKHDEALMHSAARHINDQEKLIDISRAARREIENVLAGDRGADYSGDDRVWDASAQVSADARSQPEAGDER